MAGNGREREESEDEGMEQGRGLRGGRRRNERDGEEGRQARMRSGRSGWGAKKRGRMRGPWRREEEREDLVGGERNERNGDGSPT